jgi:hypothetical protein
MDALSSTHATKDFNSPGGQPLGDRSIFVLSPSVRGEIKTPNGAGRTVFMGSLVDLIEHASRETRPVILIQGGAIEEFDIECAAGLHLLPCRPSVGVIAAKEAIDTAITMARRLGQGCVFGSDCLSYAHELAGYVQWLDAGGAPTGVESHLTKGSPLSHYNLREKGDKAPVIDEVVARAACSNGDKAFLFDLRLILEEVLNNAIYHAFMDEHGREKYQLGSFQQIGEGESINVTAGCDGRTFGVAIRDNQGKLRRDTVLHKLERHLSIQGLLDENGRGLYLTYSLAGRVIFNLRRNQMTEIVVLFPAAPGAWPECSPIKPILVFDK